MALKASDSGGHLPDASEAMTSYVAFWKSSTIDLPIALMGETLRFMSHRLQAQAEHLNALTRCRTVSEALESQAVFTRNAVSEYAAESNVLMQQARSAARLSKAT